LFPQPFLVNEDYEDKEEAFCPPTIKIKLKPIPYFTRLINVDRVGFEPTTSAMSRLVYFNPRVDWQQFQDFLLQRMNERTAKDRRAAHVSLVSAIPWKR
jgi:hypothetical protein